MFEKILFYVFAAVLIGAATMVVTRRNPIHAALYLILSFVACSGIWMLAEAEFLAITLVLVYVGAVMVLFLFVVMMLDIDVAIMKAGFIDYLPVGGLIAIAVTAMMVMVVGANNFGLDQMAAPAHHAADYSNTQEIGRVLYTVFMYPFEIAAVILLVAIVAAIRLTMRRREGTKTQDPTKQVLVKAVDRIRVIKVESDKKVELK